SSGSRRCGPASRTCAPAPRSPPSGSGCGATAPERGWPSWPVPSTGGAGAAPARTPASSTPGRPWGARGGRAQMGAVRTMLEQDAQRRFETGEGAVIPALASNDPKLAGYVAQAEELVPTFRNQMTLESLDHVLLWAPVQFSHRLAPTPLLLVTGVDDQVHAIDEVLKAYDRAWEPKRLGL